MYSSEIRRKGQHTAGFPAIPFASCPLGGPCRMGAWSSDSRKMFRWALHLLELRFTRFLGAFAILVLAYSSVSFHSYARSHTRSAFFSFFCFFHEIRVSCARCTHVGTRSTYIFLILLALKHGGFGSLDCLVGAHETEEKRGRDGLNAEQFIQKKERNREDRICAVSPVA